MADALSAKTGGAGGNQIRRCKVPAQAGDPNPVHVDHFAVELDCVDAVVQHVPVSLAYRRHDCQPLSANRATCLAL